MSETAEMSNSSKQKLVSDMKVERIVLAEEIKTQNPEILAQILELLPELPVDYVPHEELKRQTKDCRAVIRSGETTPYANIILQSACAF